MQNATESGLTFLLVHILLSIIIFFFCHDGADVKYKRLNMGTTVQRITAIIMMIFIQPHFIYNTLGSIYQLCLEQPQKAAELTKDFSQYLRGNFGELDNNNPILLSKELEHVKHYVNIEQVRFPDITVDFDVRSDDFFCPL